MLSRSILEDPHDFYSICKLQATNVPPTLHEQTSTISDLLRQDKETKCYRKVKEVIIDHNETNENPLIQDKENRAS